MRSEQNPRTGLFLIPRS